MMMVLRVNESLLVQVEVVTTTEVAVVAVEVLKDITTITMAKEP